MAMHGSVGEFNPAKEDWSTYSARMDFYFQANGVTEADRKRAISTQLFWSRNLPTSPQLSLTSCTQ